MQLSFLQDSTFSYEIAPLCFLPIAFRESPWCGYITGCRRAASKKHMARGECTVSARTLFHLREKDTFLSQIKDTHTFSWWFPSLFCTLSMFFHCQFKKKKSTPGWNFKTCVTAGRSSLFWWTKLDWLDLSPEQLYKGIILIVTQSI